MFPCVSQVEETVRKNKAPNLRNMSYLYRDGEQERELVWRMACLWVESLPTQRNHLQPAAMKSLELRFYKGSLDEDMKVKARVMDPSFVFEARS